MATDDAQRPHKRKPPTFLHMHKDRAKKLKKAWVDKQKIKTKWKAEKKRQGLGSRATGPGSELEKEGEAEDGDEDGMSDEAMQQDLPTDAADHSDDDRDHEQKHIGAMKTAKEPRVIEDSEGEGSPSEQETKPDLRELARQAYSITSLHHHKADPLHRRRGADRARGRGRGQDNGRGRGHARGRGGSMASAKAAPGTSGRGGGRGGERGRETHRGRGQPDMRLRMNVMLEKIKRDYA